MLVNQIVPVSAGDIRRNGYKSSFDKHIGINTDDFTKNGGAVTVTPPEAALNPHGIVHGGWTSVLLDTVASGAAYTYQTGKLEDNEFGLTTSLNIEFKKPVFAGATYLCQGNILRREGNMIHTKAEVTDSNGIQVAAATATLKAKKSDI